MSLEDYEGVRDRLQAVLDARPWEEISPNGPTEAKLLQGAVVDALRPLGQVSSEIPVRFTGGRRGRVDVFLECSTGTTVAIELDRGRPRAKSVQKLQSLEADVRLICLRRPWRQRGPHPKIDAVISPVG